MLTRNIALINLSNAVSDADAMVIAAALQKQVSRDFSPIWKIAATVDFFQSLGSRPPGYWPICIADHIEPTGNAGYHLDSENQPYALVLAQGNVSLVASHECLEMLVDPFGSFMQPGLSIKSGQGLVRYLVEICDPCAHQSCGYLIDGVPVSDFYTPQYFDDAPVTGTRYSFNGSLTAPRQLRNGGYITWKDDSTGVSWQAFNSNGRVSYNQVDLSDRLNFSLRESSDRASNNWLNTKAARKKKVPAGQSAPIVASTAHKKICSKHNAVLREEISRHFSTGAIPARLS